MFNNATGYRLSCAVVFILFFLSTCVYGQRVNIRGHLTDSAKHPLVYATVNLYKTANSAIAWKTTYTRQQGEYFFNNIDTGTYLLQFSFAGYQQQNIPIRVSDSSGIIELPVVRLLFSTKEMQGVTVTATKRLIEVKDDGVVYHAEADPMAGTDKLIDLLRKTPMITVDADNNVLVNGQSNFRVLVNGRETSLFARNTKEALKAFPGSLVSRIEIISSPSAKYDAEGVGGIINIIMRKKILGYNGTITVDVNSLTYRGLNASGSFKHGKLGATLFLGTGGNNGLVNGETETIQALIASTFYRRLSEKKYKQTNNSPQVNLELAYELDSLSTITLYGAADKSWREDDVNSVFDLQQTPQSLTEQSVFNSFSRINTPGWSVGTDYIHKFSKNKSREYSIKVFSSTGNSETNNSSSLRGGSGNRFVRNEADAKDRQHTFQIDYVHPFYNKQKIETGVKAIIRRAYSNYNSFLKFTEPDDFQLNPGNSDRFSYRQNVWSIYSSYSFSIKKVNWRLGFRAEHTEVDGDFISSQTSVRQRYTNLAPNLLIATALKNGQFISFTYSLRLGRPYISSLNPFANNIDSLFVTAGNPNLGPQVSHISSFSYRISKGTTFVNAVLGNSYSSSYILYGFVFDKTTGVTTGMPLNGGISNLTYLNMSVNANPVPKWRISSNSTISFIHIKSKTGLATENSGFTGSIGVTSAYNFTPQLAATFNFNYYFPVVLLQGSGNGYNTHGFGGRYTFLKKKLTATVFLGSPFLKNGIFNAKSLYEDISSRRERIGHSRFRLIGVGLSWNFGKLTEGVSKKRGVQNNDLL